VQGDVAPLEHLSIQIKQDEASCVDDSRGDLRDIHVSKACVGDHLRRVARPEPNHERLIRCLQVDEGNEGEPGLCWHLPAIVALKLAVG
jgi:hypothetical protein